MFREGLDEASSRGTVQRKHLPPAKRLLMTLCAFVVCDCLRLQKQFTIWIFVGWQQTLETKQIKCTLFLDNLFKYISTDRN